MLRRLRHLIGRDTDYDDPERVNRLTAYREILDGTLYDRLPQEFHQERTDADEYVPLRDRAPSVRFNMCRTVVQDSVAMLFGEGRFPQVMGDGPTDAQAWAAFIKATKLPKVMKRAALRGAVGSTAIRFRVLNNRPFFDVLDTTYLTPIWRDDAPDTLDRVVERYKVKGSALVADGFNIPSEALGLDHWWQRTWDGEAEWRHAPMLVQEWKDKNRPPLPIDRGRSVRHDLGVVPIVWIENLPGDDEPDGACTFAPAIDSQIELEYQLSQAGRGLKYSADPTLLLKEPAVAEDGTLQRGADTALVVSKDGDAKLLEISGGASAAVIEYCRALREYALESVRGHRAAADKISAAQSGRALELMYQPLVWLTDDLRTSYGESGLLDVLRMVQAVVRTGRVRLKDRDGAALEVPKGDVTLRWPAFFPATHEDKQSEATALATLIHDEVISKQTATRLVAPNYDIEDIEAERGLIAGEMAEQMQRAQQVAAQVKLNETGEA